MHSNDCPRDDVGLDANADASGVGGFQDIGGVNFRSDGGVGESDVVNVDDSLASAIASGGDSGPDKRLSFTIRRVARVISADSVMEHPEARREMERRRRGFERSVTETGAPSESKSRS